MTKCLIIGSGIVGLITAYELRKSGCNVTVIDSNKAGQASSNAAGILFPLSPWKNHKNMQELCIEGHKAYCSFFNNLTKKEKEEFKYERKRILLFGNNLDQAKRWYKDKEIIKSSYVNKKINSLENNIKELHENYIEIPDINIISPINFLFFLKNILLKNKVNFIKDEIENIEAYLKRNENREYDYIIISAGAWSNKILGKKNLNIKPIKGQLLHIEVKKKLIDNILIYNDYYIFQRENKEIIVGSTIEDVGFDEGVTKSAKNYLEESLSELFLEKLEIGSLKQTYGFRPYSEKDKPHVCVDSNNNKIIYNFGHYRYGILTAIPSAKMVKEFII